MDSTSSALLSSLSWVDVAIFCEVQRVRARGRALGKDAPWGAYIGEAEVDEVLGDLLSLGPFQLESEQLDELRALLATRREEAAAAWTDDDRLSQLARAFGLDSDDVDLLLLSLAAEVNPRYLRLFGYLQDDFNAQHLTPGLALRLLADRREERLRLAAHLSPDGPLIRHRLLLLDDGVGPVQARQMLASPRIARWLLHDEPWDPDLHPWARLETDGSSARLGVAAAVDGLLEALHGVRDPVLRIAARSRRDLFEASRHLARRLASPLLVADLAAAGRLGIPAEATGWALAREARLQGAVLLVLDPPAPGPDGDPLASLLLSTEGSSRPLLLHARGSGGEPLVPGRRHLLLELPGLPLAEREEAWLRALAGLRSAASDSHLYDSLMPDVLARRYRFTPGQIEQVIDLATDRAVGRGASSPSADDVLEACADAFLPDPGPLAQRVAVKRGWEDLILPADTRSLLREMLGQVERREQVLEALGQSRVRQGERGIKALFSGPPGTGKSLSAEVLARSLGYPLFRVDLASVVSKYVGETEKQLGRLFSAAEESPCVLLFDEADALFGKRAEVKGAQDRFANLEVSYLLQRLEAFDGVAILTSNLKRNIDEAFLRRFTFVVDFPFPEKSERLRIWQRVLTERFPLADDVSLEAVAGEFKLAGANIWNVAVSAAVSAAGSDGQRITRAMLAHAVRREYQKLGREVAALRPTLLRGSSQETEPRMVLSAAEARRRTMETEEASASPPQKGPPPRAPSAAEARRARDAAQQRGPGNGDQET